jgi:flagellar biosynthesis protein FlhF
MRVKRYVVDSMPDALQKIRSDLGKDAVILNTKEIRSGGFLGLFGKKKIEVIAATDTNAQSSAAAASSAATAFSKVLAQASSAGYKPQPQVKEAYAAAASKIAVLDQEEAFYPKPSVPPVEMPAAKAFEMPKAQAAPAIIREPAQEDRLIAEIKQMKEMMSRLATQQELPPVYPEPLEKLRLHLLDQEVSPDIVRKLVEEAWEEVKEKHDTSWNEEQARELIRSGLHKIIHTDEVRGIRPDTRIAHFVGPTGVGKTTTIAKLAAEQVLKHNRKVGFITSDTYRIAAVEQLKTYGNILNVPLEVVFSPQELSKAFHQLEDRDIIFMDTAGRNFRNQMYVSELNSLLATRGNSETFLVLSLTAKYKDMQEITRNFAKFHLDKVLFTKKDETHSYGTIVNLLYDFPIKLSYVTNGQNVPDDISEASTDRILDLILGGEEHE